MSFIKNFFFFSLILINLNAFSQDENFSEEALELQLITRISPQDKRFATMLYALRLLSARKVHTIVETGTARYGVHECIGDGCSTIIWGQWAAKNSAVLYSVDINENAINEAQQASKSYSNYIHFKCCDSVSFLQNFSGVIDFLYLDSFDYDLDNPHPSQDHHLKEIIAAYEHLTKNSIVMIDDCDLQGGGKGKYVIQYLLERGWKIIAEGYQVILVQN